MSDWINDRFFRAKVGRCLYCCYRYPDTIGWFIQRSEFINGDMFYQTTLCATVLDTVRVLPEALLIVFLKRKNA